MGIFQRGWLGLKYVAQNPIQFPITFSPDNARCTALLLSGEAGLLILPFSNGSNWYGWLITPLTVFGNLLSLTLLNITLATAILPVKGSSPASASTNLSNKSRSDGDIFTEPPL